MKNIILFGFVLMTSVSFSQEEKNKCTQLPFAVVDEQAVLKSDIPKMVEEAHPVSFADKNEHTGTYKVVVDCNGEVISVMYRDGNYSEQEQVWMFAQLKSTEWKPAILEKKEVSSTVFVTVSTKELVTEVSMK